MARRWGVRTDDPVLAVKHVRRGSLAHRTGLRPNDLILSVDRSTISTARAFRQYLAKMQRAGRDSVLLRVRRGSRNLFVTLPLPSD